jgi:predicted dehydrogenase
VGLVAGSENIMMRLALIGCGGIGQAHSEMLRAQGDARIIACCDPNEAAANAMAGQWGAKAYPNLSSLLERETVDAAWICVPPSFHQGEELLLADRRIPFFVEKPVSLDLAYALKVKAAVEKAGIITSVGYHWRYKESVRLARERIRGQAIPLVSVVWSTSMPPVEWWQKMATSGGMLVEQVTHLLDLARYLVGEVSEVSGLAYYEPAFDIPLTTAVNLSFESGSIGSVAASTLGDAPNVPSFRVFLKNQSLDIRSRELVIAEQGKPEEKLGGFDNGMPEEQRCFLNAVARKDPTGVTSPYADAVESLRLSLAANHSIRTKKGVAVRTFAGDNP